MNGYITMMKMNLSVTDVRNIVVIPYIAIDTRLQLIFLMFISNNTIIKIIETTAYETSCRGIFCYRQQVLYWNNQIGCGLYLTSSNRRNIEIRYTIFRKMIGDMLLLLFTVHQFVHCNWIMRWWIYNLGKWLLMCSIPRCPVWSHSLVFSENYF